MKAPFEKFYVSQDGLYFVISIKMGDSLIHPDYDSAGAFIESAIREAIERANTSSTANLASSPPPPEGSKS